MKLEYHSFMRDNRKLRIIRVDKPVNEVVIYDIDPKEKLETIKEWIENERLNGRECMVDFKDRVIVCARSSVPQSL